MEQSLGRMINELIILVIRRAVANDAQAKVILDRLIGKQRDRIDQYHYQVFIGAVVPPPGTEHLDATLAEVIQAITEGHAKEWDEKNIDLIDSVVAEQVKLIPNKESK